MRMKEVKQYFIFYNIIITKVFAVVRLIFISLLLYHRGLTWDARLGTWSWKGQGQGRGRGIIDCYLTMGF